MTLRTTLTVAEAAGASEIVAGAVRVEVKDASGGKVAGRERGRGGIKRQTMRMAAKRTGGIQPLSSKVSKQDSGLQGAASSSLRALQRV